MSGQDDEDRKREVWESTRAQLASNAKSNAEAFDRALLTLSSAFLGGSWAFIDHMVPGFPTAVCGKAILYAAWLLFTATIVLTVVSLMYGVLSFRWLEQAADRFFGQDDKSAWEVSDKTQRTVMRFILACGTLFIGGIVLLVTFVFINLSREPQMSKSKSTPQLEERGIPNATFPQKPQSKPTNAGSSENSGTQQQGSSQSTPGTQQSEKK